MEPDRSLVLHKGGLTVTQRTILLVRHGETEWNRGAIKGGAIRH